MKNMDKIIERNLFYTSAFFFFNYDTTQKITELLDYYLKIFKNPYFILNETKENNILKKTQRYYFLKFFERSNGFKLNTNSFSLKTIHKDKKFIKFLKKKINSYKETNEDSRDMYKFSNSGKYKVSFINDDIVSSINDESVFLDMFIEFYKMMQHLIQNLVKNDNTMAMFLTLPDIGHKFFISKYNSEYKKLIENDSIKLNQQLMNICLETAKDKEIPCLQKKQCDNTSTSETTKAYSTVKRSLKKKKICKMDAMLSH